MTKVHKMITVAAMVIVTVLLTNTTNASNYDTKLFEGFNPGTNASKSAFSYDTRSFYLNGKPMYIYCGEMHYARVPRELWRDRLMKIKLAGYNTVTSYVFWNSHEPIEGEFHWERNLDVDAFCSLADSLGLYVMLRVGPYCCGEWDAGGYPPWLADKPNLKYRNLSGPFFSYVKAYWKQLFPKFLKYQIHKGGSLIAIQIENEIMVADKPYRDSLCNYALSLGLEVPYIYSQIMNGNEPSSWLNAKGQFNSNGKFPWMTTEFWMGWFNLKGEPTAAQLASCILGSWRYMALGSGGLSHYMIHGGTNFGYTASDDNQFTSYDYHAPIAEEGGFHKNYWAVKEVGHFIRTFEPIIAASTNGSSLVSVDNSSTFTLYAHTTPSSGTVAIIENWKDNSTMNVTWTKKGITVPTSGKWSGLKEKWYYFVSDVPVTSNTTIDYSATGIMCIKKLGTKNYLVLYGAPGSQGEIAFAFKTAPSSTPSSPWTWSSSANRASLSFTYPMVDSITEVTLSDGANQTLNLLIMDTTQAIRKTWILDNYIASGAEYVDHDNMLHFSTNGGRAFIYSDTERRVVTKGTSSAKSPMALSSGWKWITAASETGTSYDDSNWQSHSGYQDMASFGWPNGYGWYRATYNATSAGSAIFSLNGGVQDAYRLFVNGAASGSTMQLNKGDNTIAVLAIDYSRFKEYDYYGSPRDLDRSGLISGIKINNVNVPLKFKGGFEGVDESPLMGVISDTSWNQFMSRPGWSSTSAPDNDLPKFWRYDFQYTAPTDGKQTWNLNAPVARLGRGVVWLNGQNIGRTIDKQWPMYVPACWLKNGTNTFMVLTEDGKQPSNWEFTPIEYHSFESSGITHTIDMQASQRAASIHGTTSMKVATNRLTIPSKFAGKMLSVSVYNLTGKLLSTFITSKSVVDLAKVPGISSSIHVVKIKVAR